jgi:predicted transcriptional regulator
LPPNLPIEPVISHKRSGYTHGARKSLLLVLSTGPCKENDVCRMMHWERRKFRMIARPAIKDQLVSFKDNMYVLTTKGIQAVAWYNAHPMFTMYLPNKVK